ncbi:MAG TPA: PIN domain-containing protein [Thermoanaerobaculia bacterium]|nr:PIN domain-containing protein [Thermoanaerobaculia bacterium]
MRAVLADTGPLYALVDPSDQYHVRARGEMKRLQEEQAALAVAFPTLLETQKLILQRLGVRVAQRWTDEILDGVDLVNPHREDYLKASGRIHQLPDQSITLFDAVLAVLAEQLRFPVWTYDHHFDRMRTPVWR